MLLGINTADKITEICLIDGKRILFDHSGASKQDEAETLLTALCKNFRRYRIEWKDISALFVVRGPGNFTSVRVGIAIANTLAFALKIPLYAMTLSELLDFRIKKDSLGSTLLKIKFAKLNCHNLIQPYYDREPNISKSSKPLSYC